MVKYPLRPRYFLLAGLLTLMSLFAWEVYWRNQGYSIGPEDDKHLWAVNRARVADFAPGEGVVIIGSSRALFNLQVDVWEAETGIRPLQLSTAGTTPVPILIDIVQKTSFSGTLVMGYTPGLYFRELDGKHKSDEWVTHYYQRTYADRLNHRLSRPLQQSLAFLNTDEDGFYNELDLATLISQIPLPERIEGGRPPFPIFSQADFDRNTVMLDVVVRDTTYARHITDFWEFVTRKAAEREQDEETLAARDAHIDTILHLVNTFRERGGQFLLLRNPSQNTIREREKIGFPRALYWDVLVDSLACPAYHYEDYPFMGQYFLPEWSHMSAEDARTYTRELVQTLQSDGHL